MKKYSKYLVYICFWSYIVILYRITVFRGGFSAQNLFQNGVVSAGFFHDYLEMLRSGMFYEFIYLFVGNIIWFVPFGFLTPWINKRFAAFPKVLLFGFLMSLSIEFFQFMFGTGISEVDDLILNTLGVYIGFLLRKAIVKRNK